MYSPLKLYLDVNGKPRIFNFSFSGNSEHDAACVITSGAFHTVVDEDFVVIESNMPKDWIKAIQEKLEILAADFGESV